MKDVDANLAKYELSANTALLVSIRSALQANWQKPLFGSQCKSNELATRLE
jgi:hypothetical protein